jgi:hypothetical protein
VLGGDDLGVAGIVVPAVLRSSPAPEGIAVCTATAGTAAPSAATSTEMLMPATYRDIPVQVAPAQDY